MSLFKLRVSAVDLEAGRAACAALGALDAPGALAVTLFEALPAGFVVEAYYDGEFSRAALDEVLAPLAGTLGALSVELVPEQNWVALSQASLPPIAAGRLRVHGSHDRRRVGGMRRTAIEIEAGEAFGTGHNATTALCLEALDRLARTRRFARVLDLGCGSGVLAIAAARALPKARVLAVDNDPVATAVARENVRLNRVGARVAVLDGSGLAHSALRAAGSFDLILANILPRPLLALAPAIRCALEPGGVVVLSGLLDAQAREVRARYLNADFQQLDQTSRAGWTALTLRRR
jgi:ribosomal protein L11 methyltransferase